MSNAERRRHVRLKPIPELPARAVLASSGLVREALDVMDISAGGLALVSPPGGGPTVGSRLDLHLTLGRDPERAIVGTVRWAGGGAFGVEFVEPSPEAAQSIRRYISELLERGLSV